MKSNDELVGLRTEYKSVASAESRHEVEILQQVETTRTLSATDPERKEKLADIIMTYLTWKNTANLLRAGGLVDLEEALMQQISTDYVQIMQFAFSNLGAKLPCPFPASWSLPTSQ